MAGFDIHDLHDWVQFDAGTSAGLTLGASVGVDYGPASATTLGVALRAGGWWLRPDVVATLRPNRRVEIGALLSPSPSYRVYGAVAEFRTRHVDLTVTPGIEAGWLLGHGRVAPVMRLERLDHRDQWSIGLRFGPRTAWTPTPTTAGDAVRVAVEASGTYEMSRYELTNDRDMLASSMRTAGVTVGWDHRGSANGARFGESIGFTAARHDASEDLGSPTQIRRDFRVATIAATFDEPLGAVGYAGLGLDVGLPLTPARYDGTFGDPRASCWVVCYRRDVSVSPRVYLGRELGEHVEADIFAGRDGLGVRVSGLIALSH
jgi:hypothetical protein